MEGGDMKFRNWSAIKKLAFGAFTAVSLVMLPASVQAAEITGFLGISGGVIYDAVNSTGGAVIDWAPADLGIGASTVVTQATGYFNPDGLGPMGIDVDPFLTASTSLTIRDITNVPPGGPIPAPAYAPAGPANVPNFLSNFVDNFDHTLLPLVDLHFDLTEVVRQTGFPACTPAASLGTTCVLGDVFVVTQTSEGLRILMDVRGYFRNLTDQGYFGGAFSTTFKGLTFAEAFARLAAGQDLNCNNVNTPPGGTTFCTFDANFNNISAVPEPTTLLTFGTGAAILARRIRRRKA
jgi:hypothetical protein